MFHTPKQQGNSVPVLFSLSQSQGRLSPIYSKRLDKVMLPEKLRAHTSKHIFSDSDDILDLNNNPEKLKNFLMKKGFHLAQDVTLFTNEQDAEKILKLCLESRSGLEAREILKNETSARIAVTFFEDDANPFLSEFEYYEWQPNVNGFQKLPLKAVMLVLEENPDNPKELFVQTAFPIGSYGLKTFAEECINELKSKILLHPNKDFGAVNERYIDYSLLEEEDRKIVEEYQQAFAEFLKSRPSTPSPSPKTNAQTKNVTCFSKEDTDIIEVCRALYPKVLESIERFINNYIKFYQCQIQEINHNGNCKVYNFYNTSKSLKCNSFFVEKIFPFREFREIGTPTALAMKGCDGSQVKAALTRFNELEQKKKLDNLLERSFEENASKKIKRLLAEISDIFIVQDLLLSPRNLTGFYDHKKIRELENVLLQIILLTNAFEHNRNKSQFCLNTLKDILKPNLSKQLQEMQTFLANYEQTISISKTIANLEENLNSFIQSHHSFIIQAVKKQPKKIAELKTLTYPAFSKPQDKDLAKEVFELIMLLNKKQDKEEADKENAELSNSNTSSLPNLAELLTDGKEKSVLEIIKEKYLIRKKSRLENKLAELLSAQPMVICEGIHPCNHIMPLLSALNKKVAELLKLKRILDEESENRDERLQRLDTFNRRFMGASNTVKVLKSNLNFLSALSKEKKLDISELNDYFMRLTYSLITISDLLRIWENSTSISSRLINNDFQRELGIPNPNSLKYALKGATIDFNKICESLEKGSFLEKNKTHIDVKIIDEFLRFYKNLFLKMIESVENNDLPPLDAVKCLTSSMEDFFKHEVIAYIKKTMLLNNKTAEEKKNSEEFLLALNVFWDRFAELKNMQNMLTVNPISNPISLFLNRSMALIGKASKELDNCAISGNSEPILSLFSEILENYEGKLSFYKECLSLDLQAIQSTLSEPAVTSCSITHLYSSIVCQSPRNDFSFNTDKQKFIPISVNV